MVLVDTNILLYAVNRDSPNSALALEAIETLMNGTEDWVLTWGIIYEFMRVVTHPRVFENPLTIRNACDLLEDWISSESCSVISDSDFHLQEMKESIAEVSRISGNMLHDLHHAVNMREHGITEILTADRDFLAFPWVRIRTLNGD